MRGGEGRIALTELEERLRLITETVEALKERIAELSARGVPREALISAVMSSVEGAYFLRDEERAILTSVFRQNVAIQRPNLSDVAVSGASSAALSP